MNPKDYRRLPAQERLFFEALAEAVLEHDGPVLYEQIEACVTSDQLQRFRRRGPGQMSSTLRAEGLIEVGMNGAQWQTYNLTPEGCLLYASLSLTIRRRLLMPVRVEPGLRFRPSGLAERTAAA